MPLQSYLKPWHGHAVRHIPKTSDPMDFGFCGRSLDHRWNRVGENTLYLARDSSVALGEFSRHFAASRNSSLLGNLLERGVYEYKLKIASTLDLTDTKVVRALSLDPKTVFLNREICRSTASFIRTATAAQAIFVPSIAFLDDESKWCLAVFLEKIGTDLGKVFQGVKEIGW
jgi:RES domain-containing protein